MGAKLIKSKEILEIGGFLNKWFDGRIRRNQNVIIAITGSTGSAKTYSSLATAEEWYKYKFNQEYPKENVCFGLGLLAKRISELNKENKLKKGELFILEEAGANFSNLDFQTKISKMFNYILQSFRSMNLILIMTLPVLTMLNKGARQLIHGHFVTAGIDYENNISKVKPYFHQLSQINGKSYWKYPRVKVNNKVLTLQRIKFKLPSEELIKSYEEMKNNFVFGLTEDFIEEANKFERDKLLKSSRKGLTPVEYDILELLNKGLNVKQIAEERMCDVSAVYYHLRCMYLKGYDTKTFLKNMKNGKSLTIQPNTPVT